MNGPLRCLFEKQFPIAKRSSKAIHRHVRRAGFRQVSDCRIRSRWLTNISQRRDSVEPLWPLIGAINLPRVHLRGDLWIIFHQSVVSSPDDAPSVGIKPGKSR